MITNPKFEARISKSETNPNLKIKMTYIFDLKIYFWILLNFVLWYSDLFT